MATNDESKENNHSMQNGHLEQEEDKQEEMSNGHQPTEPSEPERYEKKWRAKLYQLNADGGWDDLGTGYSHIDTET